MPIESMWCPRSRKDGSVGGVIFRHRDREGTIYLAEAEVGSFVATGKKYNGGITAVMSATDNVNATMLTLLSLQITGELDLIEKLILIDNGSKQPYNFDLMKRHVRIRQEGEVVRVFPNVKHGGALELIAQFGRITTPYYMMIDSDVEMLKSGCLSAMLKALEDHGAVAVGKVLQEKQYRPAPADLWAGGVALLCSYTIWKSSIWLELINECRAGAYWDMDQKYFFDNTSRIFLRACQKGYKFVDFNWEEWVKHYQGLTWGRSWLPGELRDRADKDYGEITKRLRTRFGVSDEQLFEDKPTRDLWEVEGC